MFRFGLFIIFLAGSLAGTGCSTLRQSGGGNGPVSIRMGGKPGSASETRYYSTSRILTYADKQLLRDRTETVDFTVRTEIKSVDTKSDRITYKSRTVRKDGAVALHDLAFPELNEELEYVIRSNAQVLQAGAFSPQSIFFVPSIPVPDQPVQVGDTWSMEHTWFSAREAIPLRLSITAILKDIVSCEGRRNACADLEISGSVGLVLTPTQRGSKFESKIWGRMLFSLVRGDVVWSQTRSREEMVTKSDRVLVSSCMISQLNLDAKTVFGCHPVEEPITEVPKL